MPVLLDQLFRPAGGGLVEGGGSRGRATTGGVLHYEGAVVLVTAALCGRKGWLGGQVEGKLGKNGVGGKGKGYREEKDGRGKKWR